jgi:hypothetical protein
VADNPNNLTALNARVNGILSSVRGDQNARHRQYPRYERRSATQLSVSFSGRLDYAVDEYLGLRGAGYAVRFVYQDSGDIWERVVNEGPETFRQHNWRQKIV